MWGGVCGGGDIASEFLILQHQHCGLASDPASTNSQDYVTEFSTGMSAVFAASALR